MRKLRIAPLVIVETNLTDDELYADGCMEAMRLVNEAMDGDPKLFGVAIQEVGENEEQIARRATCPKCGNEYLWVKQ